jgi:CspA family cold shock protein
MLPELHSGTVRWFDPAKAYGFLEPMGDGPDVFFYLTAVQKPYELSALRFPAKVEYEQIDTRRGPRASKLWLAGGK